MGNAEAIRLAQGIRNKKDELKRLFAGLDEETASLAPAGRWSPKEILSHVCGREGVGFGSTLQAFLDQDNPRIDVKPEDPFFSENRRRMTLARLLAEFEQEYDRMAALVEGLSEEQLKRKAHIPILKATPIGEYPTLAQWAGAIGDYHVGFHIDHMKEILQALGKRTK